MPAARVRLSRPVLARAMDSRPSDRLAASEPTVAAVKARSPEAPAAMAVAGATTVRLPLFEVAVTRRLSWKAADVITALAIGRVTAAPRRTLPSERDDA